MRSKKTALVALVLAAGLLASCSAPVDDADAQRAAFLGGAPVPVSEATIAPAPEAYHAVAVPAGYRVIAVGVASDPAGDVIAGAVEQWARANGAVFDLRIGADAEGIDEQLVTAANERPDLIVGLGAGVVDVFALTTSQLLDQQFLVVGAKLAEPTENVTSVVWPGAGFRGTGITPEADADPSAVTTPMASEAISAGFASIRLGVTGVVVSLP
ncbi:hypothetical protein DEU34_3059 [Microbacterium sp. AG1240]|nr:hypothetical protein DEU34_3059 [Microbacterium sp. AG1240]